MRKVPFVDNKENFMSSFVYSSMKIFCDIVLTLWFEISGILCLNYLLKFFFSFFTIHFPSDVIEQGKHDTVRNNGPMSDGHAKGLDNQRIALLQQVPILYGK